MGDAENKAAKQKEKDLTGLLDLPQSDLPTETDENADPFAVNEMPATEQVDSFESIDQIGMVDHPTEKTQEEIQEEAQIEPAFESFESTAEPESFLTEAHAAATDDPFALPSLPTATHVLDQVKNHSEKTRTTLSETIIHYPFHLLMKGRFGPYERDKLLLFITENPIGLSSQDLDLQINSGRVLLPRISEYAGIKLIQELRDSGLTFSFKPSNRDDDEAYEKSEGKAFHFDSAQLIRPLQSIAVLTENSAQLAQYEEIEKIESHQFIKAQMVEVEKSDLFQEIVDRMTEGLKQKARLKGGSALYKITHKITPLRLPSQYQVSVSAIALRKK